MERGSIDDVVTTHAGRTIGFLARGPEGGRTVIYVHGWPGSRLEQRFIPLEVLDRFGVRLLSVDRPGYGNTDPLAGDRITRVQDILAVCDAMEVGRFPIIGLSAGGSNVMTLAAVAPDRVARVVLVSGQMPYDDEEAIATMQPEQAAELPDLRAGRTPDMEEGCERERAEMLADTIASFEDAMATLSARERTWYAQRWVRETLGAEVREGLRASVEGYLEDGLVCIRPFEVDVASVRCPVRAVHGSADDWEPLANLKRVLDRVPDAQLVTLNGLNHFGPLLYPDLLIGLAVGQS